MKVKTKLSLILAAVISQPLLAIEITVQVFDPTEQAVPDVVVYATPLMDIENLAVNTNQLVIDQADTKFAPYVTVLQKGQTIKFINKDDITHHIYSVSGENRFEFKIKSGNERMTQRLGTAEEVAMGCNIHDWMSGFALVVDTPYFGKTNASGRLTLELPELGQYQITVWHPQLETDGNRMSETVTLTEAAQSFNLTLPKKLLPIPEQSGQDDFDFLEEY
ncbi:MAG: hypothetical protein HWE10_15390 [Gammaproteobacteria bacterium]|nr:hypothetical protein [Gammaproteobacteria bacterium]